MGDYILGEKLLDNDDNYPSDVIINVKKMTPFHLGKELVKRCGDEDQQQNLTEQGKATRQLIKTVILFIPEAIEAGADLTNTSFIFAQPGREFAIRAGNGDWEFYFSVKGDGEVRGQCIRVGSVLSWMWDSKVGTFVRRVVSAVSYDVILPAITNYVKQKITPP